MSFQAIEIIFRAEAMAHVRGSMTTLLNLDVLPDLELEKPPQSWTLPWWPAVSDKQHVWWAHNTDDCCVPLPEWLNRPLEFAILKWVKEWQGWEAVKFQRGHKGLTATQLKRYDARRVDRERAILLNVAQRCEVPAHRPG